MRLPHLLACLALVAPAVVHADPVALPEAVTMSALDASLAAMRDQWIVLVLTNDFKMTGRLVSADASWVTLALRESGEVRSVARARVASVREWRAGQPAVADAPQGVETRHVGMSFGLLPSLMLDFDWGYSYTFLNVDIFFPMLLKGGGGLVGAVGSGVAIPVAESLHWKFDLYAQALTAVLGSESGLAVGLGIGAHYTSSNGFTFAFKLPALGLASTGSSSARSQDSLTYYGYGLLCTPVLSFGYRL